MGDQCETFCFDWASLEPVYLNTLEIAFLELVLVCPPPKEPPQQVLSHPQTEAPLEYLLAPPQTEESRRLCLPSLRQRSPGDCSPQTEAPLEDLLARLQLVESLVRVLVSPSEGGAAGRPACSFSDGRVVVTVLASPPPEESRRLRLLALRRRRCWR